MNQTKPFELGLVMAGAVSAGAYTAGVIDFLIEALDRWELEKRADEVRQGPPSVPRHEVMITAMTGASAGAITAAMTTAALFAEHRPVTDWQQPPPPRSNRLYDSWVNQVDISKLLGTADLDHFGEVVSLLDSTVLTQIGQSALSLEPLPGPPRRYVADPLAVLLTVANLRGVPYGFSLFGDRERKYGMALHRDSLRFAISPDFSQADPRRPIDGMQPLDPSALFGGAAAPGRHDWDGLVNAALASGAFPIGLQARVIERLGSDYRPQPYSSLKIPPGWEETPWIYRFLAVDGGLMSNEPMSLARAYVTAQADRRQEQSGHLASGALVLVDPFPNEIDDDQGYVPSRSLVHVYGQMFKALKSQARFNAEDLELVADPEAYNRFAISPSRVGADSERLEPAIASAIMGGFGGFLAHSFRRYDFHLGRRNCQAFLARHFYLPETNPTFTEENFPAAIRARYSVRNWTGQRFEVKATAVDTETQSCAPLPIIPLFPPLDQSPPLPPWPSAADVNLEDLQRSVANRVTRVGSLLIETEAKAMLGPATALAAKTVWRTLLARRVSTALMETIEKQLQRLG